MAAAGTLIAMLAQVAGHRYGFEFWGIRTASLVDSQARLLHWSVTGRPAPEGAKMAGAEAPAAPDRPGGRRGRGILAHRPGQGGLGQRRVQANVGQPEDHVLRGGRSPSDR